MIFNAIALMAFSFAGMANDIEETKVGVEKIKIEAVNEVKKVDDPCVQFSFDALDNFNALTGTELHGLAAGKFIIAAYELCDKNR